MSRAYHSLLLSTSGRPSFSRRAFRLNEPEWLADVILRSNDGTAFCVPEANVKAASPQLHKLLETQGMTGSDDLKHLYLVEETAVVHHIAQALYPLPPNRITHIPLAIKCFHAAIKYGLSPALFPLEEMTQHPDGTNPLQVCILAWASGQWNLVAKASRFLHTVPLENLKAAEVAFQPVGSDVIKALMETKLQRTSLFNKIAAAIPHRMFCKTCRTNGRNLSTRVLQSVQRVFDQPYPCPLKLVATPQRTFWFSVVNGCPDYGDPSCGGSLRAFSFTRDEEDVLESLLKQVPQTICPEILVNTASQFRQQVSGLWDRVSIWYVHIHYIDRLMNLRTVQATANLSTSRRPDLRPT